MMSLREGQPARERRPNPIGACDGNWADVPDNYPIASGAEPYRCLRPALRALRASLRFRFSLPLSTLRLGA